VPCPGAGARPSADSAAGDPDASELIQRVVGKLVLTVQGDGYAATREFTGAARFSPVDDEGNSLADGTYTWELTVAPPALDANNYHYRSDEPSADGRSMKQGTAPEGMILSGAFTISGGAIADPGQAEPASTGSRPSTRAAARADVDDSDEANP